ncbi:hypothetical protein J3R82DRAFT_10391 [Butyriboletus roseoflavus]|nr:hypothetical protein J3R82DRAFT_10391 [Butyriboletus roseoflavus]
MKDDLSQFVLGSMTEQQLRSVVANQASISEREIVIDVWRQDRIMQSWASWLDKLQPSAYLSSVSAEPRSLWIDRIVQALCSSSPVSCPLPSRTIQISPTASSGRDSNEMTESSTPECEHKHTSARVFPFSSDPLEDAELSTGTRHRCLLAYPYASPCTDLLF